MCLSIYTVVVYLIYVLPFIHTIISAPVSNEAVYEPTTFDDPVVTFIHEHPNESLPAWPGQTMMDDSVGPLGLQSDLKQVKDDLLTRIEELKEDGERLRTSIEDSSGATHTQINSLKTQVFLKIHEMQDQVSKLGLTVTAGDCQDLYDLGYNATGVYYLQKFGRQVHCDMEAEGGGWLVIQRRQKVQPQIDFDQSWHTYKKGFGDLESEFWIGNEFLHVLTHQKAYKLVVDMVDFEKGHFSASYTSFRVGNELTQYSLDLGDFSGNTTDAFSYHHGMPFSANDRDNDEYDGGNCAAYFSGGWWYEGCYDAHLNGVYPDPPDRQNASYITWWTKENNARVPLVLTDVVLRVKPVK